MDLQDQRVLITGAGGGIGRALVRELAARGARLCALEHSPAAAEALIAELEPLGINPLLSYGDLTQAETRQAALAQVGPQGAELFEALLQAMRQALQAALSRVFFVALLVIVAAFVVNLFLKEIPLRRQHKIMESKTGGSVG